MTKTKKAAQPRKKIESVTETVDVASLKPHPRNYRKHGPDQLKHIVSSLKTYGVYRNVIISQDGTILAGHGVIEACKEEGIKNISAVRLNIKPDHPKALKILTGDNEIARGGEVDDRLLSEILKEVFETDYDGLVGTGFDENQLANLVYITRPESEIPTFEAALEWLGLPAYQKADDEANANEFVIEVVFKNTADREKFVEEKQLKVDKRSERKWQMKYPLEPKMDRKSVRFEGKDQ